MADRALPPATTDPVTTQPVTDHPSTSEISTLRKGNIGSIPPSTSEPERSRTGEPDRSRTGEPDLRTDGANKSGQFRTRLSGDALDLTDEVDQLKTGLTSEPDQKNQSRTGTKLSETGCNVEPSGEVTAAEREYETVRHEVENIQNEGEGVVSEATPLVGSGIGLTDVDRGSLEVGGLVSQTEEVEEEEDKLLIPASFLSSSPAVVDERKREIRTSCGDSVGRDRRRESGGREEGESGERGGYKREEERGTEDQPAAKNTGFPYSPPLPVHT